ncbi:hypothetical protein D3C76_1595860 [compost metagenome]
MAEIVGTHPVYKLDRRFLNQDATDEYGDKLFYLKDGFYEFNNGNRRGFFAIVRGEWVNMTQTEVLAAISTEMAVA